MATSLTISPVQINIGWNFSNTTSITGLNTSCASSVSYSDSLANGTGADQADLLFFNDYSINAAATETIDLHTTAPSTVFGATSNYTRIKLLYFEHRTAAASADCTIGGDALTGTTTKVLGAAGDTLQLRPGGVILIYAPDATAYASVANTSADEITITNNAAAAATVRFLLIGTSA